MSDPVPASEPGFYTSSESSHRPRRPPRRISVGSSSNSTSRGDSRSNSSLSQASSQTSQHAPHSEKRGPGSRLSRIQNESSGATEDVDRTPTKRIQSSPREGTSVHSSRAGELVREGSLDIDKRLHLRHNRREVKKADSPELEKLMVSADP